MRWNPILIAGLGFTLWIGLILVIRSPHEWLTLTNTPVLLILVSAVSSLLLPFALSLLLSALAVLVFNYEMVPPVHTFHVDLHEHGILLVTMVLVSWLVTYLMRRQTQIARQERELAVRTQELQQWSEQLREEDDPRTRLAVLYSMIVKLAGKDSSVNLGFRRIEYPFDIQASDSQQEAFNACLRENKAMGRGTGRYENLNDLYLPMRGKIRAHGVCVVINRVNRDIEALWIRDVQALLDQMGLACERFDNHHRAQQARELAQQQKIRSLFLTAIAHDQRTPLASIMTSASALLEQASRLSASEVRHYADLICKETMQVTRLSENTLTLARLSSDHVRVPMQSESVEDIVAAVLQRLRLRRNAYLPQVWVQPDLPLVICNMVLIEQVLDNLIDNALLHSGAPQTVSLKVQLAGEVISFEVADEGGGMPGGQSKQGDQGRGLGVGLQLCQAVADIHQGSLQLISQANSGTQAVFSISISATGVNSIHGNPNPVA